MERYPDQSRYIQFHPLAYLVKLNIEMTMANLIKQIAISTSRRTGNASLADEFEYSSNMSTSGYKSIANSTYKSNRRRSTHELATILSYKPEDKGPNRVLSFAPNEIKKTQEVFVCSEPMPCYGMGREKRKSETEVEVIGGCERRKAQGAPRLVNNELNLSWPSNLT
jgi:hypothetical protein